MTDLGELSYIPEKAAREVRLGCDVQSVQSLQLAVGLHRSCTHTCVDMWLPAVSETPSVLATGCLTTISKKLIIAVSGS